MNISGLLRGRKSISIVCTVVVVFTSLGLVATSSWSTAGIGNLASYSSTSGTVPHEGVQFGATNAALAR